MRKGDKLKQVEKANLLAEQRFIESKGLITEDTSTDIETKIKELLYTLVGLYPNSPKEHLKKYLNDRIGVSIDSVLGLDHVDVDDNAPIETRT